MPISDEPQAPKMPADRHATELGLRTVGLPRITAEHMIQTLKDMITCRLEKRPEESLDDPDLYLLLGAAVEDTLVAYHSYIPPLQKTGITVWLQHSAERLWDKI